MDKQNKPKGFVNRLAAFVMGWGFCIVLFLCVAVVDVSAWTLIAAGKRAMGDVENDLSAVVTSPGISYTEEDFYTPPAAGGNALPPETSSPEESPSQPAANLETPAAEPAAVAAATAVTTAAAVTAGEKVPPAFIGAPAARDCAQFILCIPPASVHPRPCRQKMPGSL